MKMTASRMRPTSAALFWMFGFTVGSLGCSHEIENEYFGVAALLDANLVVRPPYLHRVARSQRLPVHLRFAADHVHIDAPPGFRFESDRLGAVDEGGVEVRVLVDAYRPLAPVAGG